MQTINVELQEIGTLELPGPVDSPDRAHVDRPDQPDDRREQHRDSEELIRPNARCHSVGDVIDVDAITEWHRYVTALGK